MGRPDGRTDGAGPSSPGTCHSAGTGAPSARSESRGVYSRAELGQRDDATATAQDASGHLGVLVDRPPLIPAAEAVEEPARPHPGEDARRELDFAGLFGDVGAPAIGASGGQWRAQGHGHTPRPPLGPDGDLRAGHPVDAAPPEAVDRPGEVMARVSGVRVHASHVVAARGTQPDVQACGRLPRGVVEDPDARVRRRRALPGSPSCGRVERPSMKMNSASSATSWACSAATVSRMWRSSSSTGVSVLTRTRRVPESGHGRQPSIRSPSR